MPSPCSIAFILAVSNVLNLAQVAALDNGVALIPPRGVTTWQLFDFSVSDAKIRNLTDSIVSTGLLAAGYEILWLDDGWPTCAQFAGLPGSSKCRIPAPRGPNGSIVPDPQKFPFGLAATVAYVHSKGLKFGLGRIFSLCIFLRGSVLPSQTSCPVVRSIYSAPHAQTCGGYEGSLNHENVDAATFAAWGIDAVKMDAGCQEDCSIHDGCLLTSLSRTRDALNATGRRILFYVDDGNPTSGPKASVCLGGGEGKASKPVTRRLRTSPSCTGRPACLGRQPVPARRNLKQLHQCETLRPPGVGR